MFYVLLSKLVQDVFNQPYEAFAVHCIINGLFIKIATSEKIFWKNLLKPCSAGSGSKYANHCDMLTFVESFNHIESVLFGPTLSWSVELEPWLRLVLQEFQSAQKSTELILSIKTIKGPVLKNFFSVKIYGSVDFLCK